MALISCPECKQQVSTEAVSCPHCGKQLTGSAAAPAAGPGLFVPGGAPGPEATLWEGRPSIPLLYGKLFRLFLRLIIIIVIGYLALTSGLSVLGSLSSAAASFVEQNNTVLVLGILVVLALLLLPAVMGLLQAWARIKNTHYRVT